MFTTYLLSTLLLWALFDQAVGQWVNHEPLPARWSSLKIGPDGPWQGVEVTFGKENGGQTIVAYPGGHFFTYVLPTSYCEDSTPCYARDAGLYDKSMSEGTGEVVFRPSSDFNEDFGGVMIAGERATVQVDTIIPGNAQVEVPELSMALIHKSAHIPYPGGMNHPLFAGCLSLGAAGRVNHTFDASPPVNLSLIPGFLRETNRIPSNSFGLHIGSVNPPMPGSLYWGGYDKARLTGDVLTMPASLGPISLADVSIDVVSGASPFSYRSKAGLLAAGNSSIGFSLSVSISPCSPYISLPKSVCDAIAQDLPLEYNTGLGLYIWDTANPLYGKLLKSATVLSFTFAAANTRNITISVPFMHLNLTLDEPLVDTPTQYFPCHVGADRYALGRAFLQDAFIGNNWLASDQPSRGIFFMAQAPGPNIPAPPDVASIQPGDQTFEAGSNDWLASWDNVWSPLSDDEGNTREGTVHASPGLEPASSLGKGAITGISVGLVAAVTLLLVAALLWLRRRRKRASRLATPPVQELSGTNNFGTAEGYWAPKAELNVRTSAPVELPASTLVEQPTTFGVGGGR